MARRKSDIEEINNVVAGAPEDNVPQEGNTQEEQANEETEVKSDSEDNVPQEGNTQEEQANEENPSTTSSEEIPVSIQKVLKAFKNYAELYVGANGSVYTTDTKPSLRGNAILYKNPFYKSINKK